MNSDYIPHPVRAARLVTACVLAVMLVLSAVLVGKTAFEFGVDSLAAIRAEGIEPGIAALSEQLRMALLDHFGIGANDFRTTAEVKALVQILPGVLALLAFLVIYPLVWLTLARRAILWFREGFWALQKMPDAMIMPGDWLDKQDLITRFEDGLLRARTVSHGEVALLGARSRFMPAVFFKLSRNLLNPVRHMIGGVVNTILWGVLTVACLFFLALVLVRFEDISLPPMPEILSMLGMQIARNVAPWVALSVVVGVFGVILDMAFARALTPRVDPVASTHRAHLADRQVETGPDQIVTRVNEAMEARVANLRFNVLRTMSDTQFNEAHAKFRITVLAETQPEVVVNHAEPAARLRLAMSVVLVLLGAALLLFGLLPPAVWNALSEGEVTLAGLVAAPMWLMMALTNGKMMVAQGQRLVAHADNVLRARWYQSSVVVAELTGNVNTQRHTGTRRNAMMEQSVQQTLFDLKIRAATTQSEAPDPTAARALWSFVADAPSERLKDLFAGVIEKLSRESRLQDDFGTIGQASAEEMRLIQDAPDDRARTDRAVPVRDDRRD